MREYGIRRADYATPFYPQTLVLTSSTSGGRSVGIVRSRLGPRSLFVDGGLSCGDAACLETSPVKWLLNQRSDG
jgi:hypothetical protein